jgi:hypothetical protein
MTHEDRQHLADLLQAYRRRLRPLEKRMAMFGSSTPPEVLNEIDDIRGEITRIERELDRALLVIDPTTLLDLRRKARNAYFKKDWSQAVKLLAQVTAHDPADSDIWDKLTTARQSLQLQEDYRGVCDLRDEGLWQAVLDALDDIERRHPGYADTERLQAWAERRRDEETVERQQQESAISPHSPKNRCQLQLAPGRIIDVPVEGLILNRQYLLSKLPISAVMLERAKVAAGFPSRLNLVSREPHCEIVPKSDMWLLHAFRPTYINDRAIDKDSPVMITDLTAIVLGKEGWPIEIQIVPGK